MLLPQVLALIRVQFSDDERVRALAAFGVSIGLGQIGGQVLGGVIPYWNVFGLAWRPIFYINVPVCLIAWVCCGLWSQESRPNKLTRLDLPSSLLSVAGVGMVLVPLMGGHRTPWWPTGIASVAMGMLLLVAFLSRQRKLSMDDDGQPLVPTWLFRTRGFTIGVLLNATLYLATFPSSSCLEFISSVTWVSRCWLRDSRLRRPELVSSSPHGSAHVCTLAWICGWSC